ncbi:hypothetical protein J7J90_04755 [Candidatus Micrarchaeota archaeon]|nr:hypothetical protein [Candidatus Micrarchaeota archaeon]
MGEKDEEKLKKKLNQLPDDDFGLLICLNRGLGINFLPEGLKIYLVIKPYLICII